MRRFLQLVLFMASAQLSFADPYYIVDSKPWSSNFDSIAMDNVYGAGSWVQASFSVDPVVVFAGSTPFVMLQGSDQNATALNSFYTTNQNMIENWVYNGGRLFINAAPNQGANIDLGFDNTTLNYPYYATSMIAVNTQDSIFLGPYLPVAYFYNGNFSSHSYFTGSGLDTLLKDSLGHAQLVHKHWGLGDVYFGGLTEPNWWTPQPQSVNLWYNIIKRSTTAIPTAIGVADSFVVFAGNDCNGIHLDVNTRSYQAGMSVKTTFGDNSDDSSVVQNVNNLGGIIHLNHAYSSSGVYTVRQLFYIGATLVDSLHFSHNYQFCNNVLIKYYYDINNNCNLDSNEILLNKSILTEIDSNNVPVDTISSMSGFYYSIFGNINDIYTFKTISVPADFHFTCPANGIISDTIGLSNVTSQNIFGLRCNAANYFDLDATADVHVTGVHDQWGNIWVHNNGCLPQNATVTLFYSPKYVFSGDANPAPSSVSGNSITWTLNNLTSSDGTVDLYYVVWCPPASPLTVGDTVQEHIYINPVIGDTDSTNNIVILEDTVKGACDPNEMLVTPEGRIVAGTNLKYQVEFENVGTDTAFNIRVLDTLPNELDLNSMRMVSSSHSVLISHLSDGIHNILKFDFPDINLLDSSHHNACTGTFVFTINTKTGLPDSTLIDNRAGIFFDNNGVVMTNTVENIIGLPTNVKTPTVADDLKLYPNPATDLLTIKADVHAYNSFTVTNSVGQLILQQSISGTTTHLNIKSLPSGLYYVNFVGNKRTEVRKFVKL